MSFLTSFIGSGETLPLTERDGVAVSVPIRKTVESVGMAAASAASGTGNPGEGEAKLSWNLLEFAEEPLVAMLECYTQALISAPVVAVEALGAVQRTASSAAAKDSELDAYEQLQQPRQLLPVLATSDVWRNVRTVAGFKGFGALGLLRGHVTSFMHLFLKRVTLPILEEALNDAFDVFEDTHPATSLLANVTVDTLLSPLELIRTRLIVQSASDPRYYGFIHAAAAIHASEGPHKFSPLYAPEHLYATVLSTSISCILRSLFKSIITNDLNLSAEYNPIMYSISVLTFLAAEVFVVTPFEMARRRLQIQNLKLVKNRKAGEAVTTFETCVQVSQRKYAGVFDVIKSVLMEEGEGYVNAQQQQVSEKSGKVGETGKVVGAAGDNELDFYSALPRVSNATSKVNDWQDLYSTNSSNTVGARDYRSKSTIGKSWDGLRSLYRSYWAIYSIRVVEFFFEGLRDVGDNAWDI